MARKGKTTDVIRLGADGAAFKASMKPKKWRKFVKKTHARGYTVAGELSGNPAPLKERTPSSLKREAQRTIADAYKPVTKELTRRTAAAQYLESKRATDDATYRTWVTGEVDKLDAQSAAADTALTTQQSTIATDLNAAQKAGALDSLARVSQVAGNVSDPSQSKALDMTDADKHSDQQVADARTHSAEIRKIGSDANTVARSAMNASVENRETQRKTALWKEQSDIEGDRATSVMEQAKAAADLFGKLKENQVTIAGSNRGFALAQGELGVKADDIAAEAAESKRDFKLKNKQFNLDKWEAKHKDKADRLKRRIDYDRIASTEGQKAADRALRREISSNELREKRISRRDKNSGIDKTERSAYQQVETAKGLLIRYHRRKKPPAGARQHLRNQGVPDPMIDLAEALRHGNGKLSANGIALARRIGVKHPRYFWPQ
jgi:hypothetical protein